MATLCKYCARLNLSARCVFCGNSLSISAPAYRAMPTDPAEEEEAVVTVPVELQNPVQKKPKNRFAIAGLVLGCLGYTAILGLIFSIIGLKKSKEMNGVGKKQAIAGIIISSLMIVYLIFGVVVSGINNLMPFLGRIRH